MRQTSFQCYVTSNIHRCCESNLRVLTHYKPPLYHGLCTNLLKQSKVINVAKYVVERTQNSIHKYGATICSNGWDNVVNCPLLSMMFTCPNGDVFLGAINTKREPMDAFYICNVLVIYIETLDWTTLYKFLSKQCFKPKLIPNELVRMNKSM